LMLQKYGRKLSIRVGLHLGPVRMLMDINNRINVVGDGINVAQRIMDFSAANQITVSRAYYDVVSRISTGGEAMFEYLGVRQDKHKRSYEIYTLIDSHKVGAAGVEEVPDPGNTVLEASSEPITAQDLIDIEIDLIRAIGPLAHVLVKKSLSRASSAQELRELLSVSIQDMAVRENFVHPSNTSKHLAHSSSNMFASGNARSMTSSHRPSQSIPIPSRSDVQRTSASNASNASNASAAKALNLSPVQKKLLEQTLGQYIGPLSQTLIRKEAARHGTNTALLQALAAHIDKAEDRSHFLQALKGKL
jgi:hypothetical protein